MVVGLISCENADSPPVVDMDGGPRLFKAVLYGNYPDVKRYIEDGDEVNFSYPEGMPLIKTAVGGFVDQDFTASVSRGEKTSLPENNHVLKLLLEAGADPNALDHSGHPPLARAIFHERLGSMYLLLLYGADPDLADSGGGTPRCFAASYGAEEAIDMMFRFDPDPVDCPRVKFDSRGKPLSAEQE
ncbi:ankyrin repeat domain-containing protein [Iodidimonas sp. SYSU 1G8]|uniref:ankyrin repeat domain-containing protein n=1 Tax=Iodidimonas sp. SYSU 1G8 TaxID=3133967 RepID=UPI0031FEE3F0